ncbi:MAG: bifunctional 3-deoxy-7-phosphoheptulonate synthase/chorismate mutase type II [Prevotellaceae bacterium]|jgi:chorismate mutase|nr:bifunctional 3-deoxy-7-phosphoheptulonate synthase/chorismate mutase type II [Prevotellaceae bacterium]
MKITLPTSPIANHLENPRWPVLIAGPCSAESEEQLLDTARQLKASQRISYFRAGVWKPRTRPGSFEGMGEVALRWLQTVKAETGLPTAVEVATAEHAELALKHGVDVLWVGARSSANPFSVQEIADSLRGTDVVVLVKNPVNPDLQLWVGALERIHRAGITKLAAIHRGFSAYEQSVYRNEPVWNMAIELKTICPTLPIICDPSHISGRRSLVPLVAQKALDLNMDGLMIEVHCDPSVAKSDAEQQLLPADYAQLIFALQLREVTSSKPELRNELDSYRQQIDLLDDTIFETLSKRMAMSQKIGQYKKDNNLMVLQLNRWEDILEQRSRLAAAMGLSSEFAKRLLVLVHEESINLQTEIMNS